MFRLFGVLGFGRRMPASAAHGNPYAEALLAGWVPPPAALAVARLEARLAEPAARHKPDSVTFLARVYRNQEC